VCASTRRQNSRIGLVFATSALAKDRNEAVTIKQAMMSRPLASPSTRIIRSDSDDESAYFDTDDEESSSINSNSRNAVRGTTTEDVLASSDLGNLRPMRIGGGGHTSATYPFLINDDSNAEIIDSIEWNFSSFLEWLPLEKIQAWLTLRSLFYALILLALKVGVFLVFGYFLFGSQSKPVQTSSVSVPVPSVAQWSTSFRRVSALREQIRQTSNQAKNSNALQSSPIHWKSQSDTMEVR
jgi:hypothetical protein